MKYFKLIIPGIFFFIALFLDAIEKNRLHDRLVTGW